MSQKNPIAYQVINAQLFQLQHNRAQVGPQDLWVGLLLKVLFEGGLSIQPEALARLCTPSTPSPLVSAGLHDDFVLRKLLICGGAASTRFLNSTCTKASVMNNARMDESEQASTRLCLQGAAENTVQAKRERAGLLPTSSCPEI